MKKTLFIALISVFITSISCSKGLSEEPVSTGNSPIFTATINNSLAKTTINTTDGKISWEMDDEVSISDGTNTAIYSISKIEEGKAIFVKKSGDDLKTSGVTYNAIYGTAPTSFQTHSAIARRLPMTATSTTNVLTFNVTCGLLKITLTKIGVNIKSISVTGTPAGGTEKTFTLTCDTAQSIDSEKDFYLSLPKGIYSQFKFVDSEGKVCIKTTKEVKSTSIEGNRITPLSLSSSLEFDYEYVDLGLSVLWATCNIGATCPEEYGRYFAWSDVVGQTWDGSQWSESEFSTTPECELDSIGNLKLEYDAAHVLLGGDWRMPVKDELQELVDNCTSTWTNVSGVNGCLFTSNMAGYTDKSIFLPAAGAGYYELLADSSFLGFYWSSTFISKSEAWSLCFFNGGADTYEDSRFNGFPVRSVKEKPAADL